MEYVREFKPRRRHRHHRFQRLYGRPACRRHSDRGSRRMGQEIGPRRLDRAARARPRALVARPAQFHLHDLAIEDAEHPHQRPKIEQYGDALFIVARTAQLIEGRVTFGETHLFVGSGYIVSVRHGPSTSYAAVRQHWEAARFRWPRARTSSFMHSRFHRRQLHACARADRGRGRGDRGQGSAEADDRVDIERLYMLRRICCACATRQFRWWKSAAG